MSKSEKRPTEFVLGPKTRASYAHLLEKTSFEGGKAHYYCSFLIRKDDENSLNAVKKAIEAAYEEGKNTLKGTGKTVPAFSSLKSPIHDGDEEFPDRAEYKKCYFLNANSYNRYLTIIDTNYQPIEDHDDIYSGM